MLHRLGYMIDRFDGRPRPAAPRGAEQLAVAIRRARAADATQLCDLAALDCADPLEGPVLVAVVEGRIWAALGLDDDRVVADPFLPTACVVELLRMRVRQLHAAEGRSRGGLLPRRIVRRARA
ncbi:MAG TPA: hypothetical protein VNT54_11845 [Solirubrobacteraceae bacterium]|nr:hypothetical protein [Solirubrobacteraceae bacterium]